MVECCVDFEVSHLSVLMVLEIKVKQFYPLGFMMVCYHIPASLRLCVAIARVNMDTVKIRTI